jgi:hypothetical protein
LGTLTPLCPGDVGAPLAVDILSTFLGTRTPPFPEGDQKSGPPLCRGGPQKARLDAVSLDAVLRAAGLPGSIPEHRFASPRRWRFHYAWPAHRLAPEIEGGTWTRGRHVRGRGYEADCEKYNTAALRGWRVLRVTTAMIRDGRALALLARALDSAEGGDNRG